MAPRLHPSPAACRLQHAAPCPLLTLLLVASRRVPSPAGSAQAASPGDLLHLLPVLALHCRPQSSGVPLGPAVEAGSGGADTGVKDSCTSTSVSSSDISADQPVARRISKLHAWEDFDSASGSFLAEGGAELFDAAYCRYIQKPFEAPPQVLQEADFVDDIHSGLTGLANEALSNLGGRCSTQNNGPAIRLSGTSAGSISSLLTILSHAADLCVELQSFVYHFKKVQDHKSLKSRWQPPDQQQCQLDGGSETGLDRDSEDASKVLSRPCELVNQAFLSAVDNLMQTYMWELNMTFEAVEREQSAQPAQKSGDTGHADACQYTRAMLQDITGEMRARLRALASICFCGQIWDKSVRGQKEDDKLLACDGCHSVDPSSASAVSDPVHSSLLHVLFWRACDPYFEYLRSYIHHAGAGDAKVGLMEALDLRLPCFLQELEVPLLRTAQQLQGCQLHPKPMDDDSAEPTGGSQMPLDIALDKGIIRDILSRYHLISQRCVALFLEDLSLSRHLMTLRRFFFLGAGDWADHFSASVCRLSWEGKATCSRVADALDESLTSTSGRWDPQNQWLQVRVDKKLQDDGVSFVQLHYNVEWPLSLVLHGTALMQYQEIFSVLLNLKAASHSLHHVWEYFSKSPELSDISLKSPQHPMQQPILHLLRHMLAHIVRTVLHWMQRQLLEKEWRYLNEYLSGTIVDIFECIDRHNSKVPKLRCLVTAMRRSDDLEADGRHILSEADEIKKALFSDMKSLVESNMFFFQEGLDVLCLPGINPATPTQQCQSSKQAAPANCPTEQAFQSTEHLAIGP
eukprot:SM000027S09710  [mRNA]  locus=s27:987100:992454:+ [translate_table: standard]